MLLNNSLALRIACDGESSSGKSTAAKLISKKYNLFCMNSGLLFRYASFLIIKYKPKKNIPFLKKKFKNLNYKKLNKINLHSPKISEHSAIIAKINEVRKILKKFQTNFSKKNKNCVIEGRDSSTKIIPNSDVKFFFKCSLNIAAVRRYNELKKTSPKIKLNEVKKALRIRNISDIKRKHSPLKKHKNAIVIDTGKLNKQAMLIKMSKYVDKMINAKYGN